MEELDRILSSEEPLTPSSGFAAGVMDAVRAAAAEPPPLPFPWGRFLAGAVACGACAASGSALVMQMDPAVFSAVALELTAVAPELGYAAATVLVALGTQRVRKVFAR